MTSPTNWVIVSGASVSIGDRVRLDISPDSAGEIVGVNPHTGLPMVVITDGPGVGGTVYPFPGQMLGRVHNP
ncbi:hypothetical protein ACFQZ4_39870 [Catellatospora coxensis]|uniref:Uncharacterized protein n=1 Tax=Catellatospora coxensis TaxID=310354 RepID=A0A8J3KW60_9ACTN|nr:hypothetical protein [Catellatospora coxensis]GIG09728.1 hypothetical protein Cco03nite_64280 [Catellatospora coxensis]